MFADSTALSSGLRPRWLWPAVVTFFLTLLLGGWQNDFPFYWHVDEPGKARQIITGERNLHHPLLMLSTAQVVVKGLSIAAEPQAVVETGRWVSATFNALAAALLAILLTRAVSPVAGWIGGLLAATHWNIFELSHYFKEDPSLSFGLMTALVALGLWRRRPRVWAGMGFGAGLALAVSGKYVGVVALLLVPLAWWKHPTPPGQRLRAATATLAAFLAVFAVINAPMFAQPDVLQASLKKETTGVLEGGPVATHHGFHFGFFKRFIQVTKAALWPGVLFFCVFSARRARNWPVELAALLVLPLFFSVLLGFSQMDSGRYYLPAVFGCCALAAVGWHDWLAWWHERRTSAPAKPTRWAAWLTVMAVLVTVGAAVGRLYVYGQGFRQATRLELARWIAEQLPLDAVIAQSDSTKLPDPSFPGREGVEKLFPQTLHTLENLPRRFTVADLRAQGITHLAAAESEWRPFLRKGKVREGKKENYQRQRAFWTSLEKEAVLVWECPAGKVGTHNPPLRLWRLLPSEDQK